MSGIINLTNYLLRWINNRQYLYIRNFMSIKLSSFHFKKKDTIHIIGIGGIGMSGLAKLLNQFNILVQGSDLCDNQHTQELRKLGIRVFIGHKVSNIINCQLVVKSSGVALSM